MKTYFTKSGLRKAPAFAINERERPPAPVSESAAVLDALEKSLSEMERISEALGRLSLTQDSISQELAKMVRRPPQSEFFELRRRLAEDYFPVMDSLERLTRLLVQRARSAGEGTALLGPLAEGARIIEQKGLMYLEAMGVQPISAIGRHFEPTLHEAVETRPAPAGMEGRVLQEVMRGYRMGEKILRVSQVIVGTGQQSTPPQQDLSIE